jgi:hypothetical protein
MEEAQLQHNAIPPTYANQGNRRHFFESTNILFSAAQATSLLRVNSNKVRSNWYLNARFRKLLSGKAQFGMIPPISKETRENYEEILPPFLEHRKHAQEANIIIPSNILVLESHNYNYTVQYFGCWASSSDRSSNIQLISAQNHFPMLDRHVWKISCQNEYANPVARKVFAILLQCANDVYIWSHVTIYEEAPTDNKRAVQFRQSRPLMTHG